METQVLEGTISDIQRQLSELALGDDERLRVVVASAFDNPALAPDTPPFRPSRFRNGVPLLPEREVDVLIDLDLVKRLLDEDVE